MATHEKSSDVPFGQRRDSKSADSTHKPPKTNPSSWMQVLRFSKMKSGLASASPKSPTHDGNDEMKANPERWSMGVLNDRETEEVPGECRRLHRFLLT